MVHNVINQGRKMEQFLSVKLLKYKITLKIKYDDRVAIILKEKVR
ncbi:hypothetical protein [Hathewaya proteolytica]|nr:hypothetical protein [Hathewaya proteolytica]